MNDKDLLLLNIVNVELTKFNHCQIFKHQLKALTMFDKVY